MTHARRTYLTLVATLALVATFGCRRSGVEPPPEPIEPRTALPEVDVPPAPDDDITFDGVLDEPAWQDAALTEAFVQPGDGMIDPVSDVAATARLAWTDEALLIAFEVYDVEPTSPHERDAEDPHIWEAASGIELMLQPGDPGDNTHYYEVQVDVAGAVWDTRFDDYNNPVSGEGAARTFGHQDWSAALERGVTTSESGYVVEMALPWSAITSPHATIPTAVGDTWRVNLYAFRDGQRAAVAWSPLLGEGNFHRSARFGRVTFTDGTSTEEE